MIYIAHRGLLNGPDKNKENTLPQIRESLLKGFDCEIDVWLVNDEWYLGHDGPDTKISLDFITQNWHNLWIHTKNEESFIAMVNMDEMMNFFWHDTDTYTLTSLGYPWVYPGEKLFSKAVCVLPERVMKIHEAKGLECFAVCSDYIEDIRELDNGK
jgi:hypothetical protein